MFFFEGLGVFWVCLGSPFGLLEFFLGGFFIEKHKKHMFFKVFENAGFWFFEDLVVSFGIILAIFGRSDPKLGSKMSFNIF